eukprot:3778071-Pyramimonas_sp.AAC.1
MIQDIRPQWAGPPSCPVARASCPVNHPYQALESTIGEPMTVCRQGIYVEYSVKYSKCHAPNGILVSTVDC